MANTVDGSVPFLSHRLSQPSLQRQYMKDLLGWNRGVFPSRARNKIGSTYKLVWLTRGTFREPKRGMVEVLPILLRLPRKVSFQERLSVNYGTEYSSDTIEILPGLISKGDRVLGIDDLVATGGSLAAAAELISQAGGIPIGSLSILQVPSLIASTREKLSKLSEKIWIEVTLHVLLPFTEPNST